MFTSMYVSMSCFYMLLVVFIELLLFSYDTLSEMTKKKCTIINFQGFSVEFDNALNAISDTVCICY